VRILLLGVGMQGKAALYDLAHSDGVSQVLAADKQVDGLREFVAATGIDAKVTCQYVDASDPASLDQLFSFRPLVTIDLLPPAFIPNVVQACLRHGSSLVNTYYAIPEVRRGAQEADSRGVSVLPECGLDPGLDLLLLRQAFEHLDTVASVRMYGAGIPAPSAADNPLGYKVSWTFRGVLETYFRPARLLAAGDVIDVDARDIFSPANVHQIHIAGIGGLEAFPNEDAIAYLERLEFDRSRLKHAGRYTMRWPGHCAFWKRLVDLHLLDAPPVEVGGDLIDRKDYLAAALGPHLGYGPEEKDLAIVRIEAEGALDGAPRRVVYQLIDERDMETGFTAMSRTVGFSASIGAQMIGSGRISGPGMLSMARDVPFDEFSSELRSRGVHIHSELSPMD
jgi:lysine 6-dehydrogenase